jgi:hypothetical protein
LLFSLVLQLFFLSSVPTIPFQVEYATAQAYGATSANRAADLAALTLAAASLAATDAAGPVAAAEEAASEVEAASGLGDLCGGRKADEEAANATKKAALGFFERQSPEALAATLARFFSGGAGGSGAGGDTNQRAVEKPEDDRAGLQEDNGEREG